MKLPILLTICSLEITATNIILSKIGLKATVQLMSQLPDGNFTNLVIIQESQKESDEEAYEEIITLTEIDNNVMTAKKLLIR